LHAIIFTLKKRQAQRNFQAVTLRSASRHSVFHQCGIFGYQDSLYAFSMTQIDKECAIAITMDYICGDVTTVFQDCRILAKKCLPKQKNVVTAQSRTNPREPSGFSFQFCQMLPAARPPIFCRMLEPSQHTWVDRGRLIHAQYLMSPT
jgi:pectinesterase